MKESTLTLKIINVLFLLTFIIFFNSTISLAIEFSFLDIRWDDSIESVKKKIIQNGLRIQDTAISDLALDLDDDSVPELYEIKEQISPRDVQLDDSARLTCVKSFGDKNKMVYAALFYFSNSTKKLLSYAVNVDSEYRDSVYDSLVSKYNNPEIVGNSKLARKWKGENQTLYYISNRTIVYLNNKNIDEHIGIVNKMANKQHSKIISDMEIVFTSAMPFKFSFINIEWEDTIKTVIQKLKKNNMKVRDPQSSPLEFSSILSDINPDLRSIQEQSNPEGIEASEQTTYIAGFSDNRNIPVEFKIFFSNVTKELLFYEVKVDFDIRTKIYEVIENKYGPPLRIGSDGSTMKWEGKDQMLYYASGFLVYTSNINVKKHIDYVQKKGVERSKTLEEDINKMF